MNCHGVDIEEGSQVLTNLEELAFLGNVGERVIIITVKPPWAAKMVASLPS